MIYLSLSDEELIALFERECKQKGLGAVDPLLCLELMRRAFAQRVTSAFETVEQYYGKLFLFWVWKEPAFYALSERWGNTLAADVLQEAYANIFRAMRRFGDPDAFYTKFDGICRKFLGFMRTCIHSAVQDLRRGDHRADGDTPIGVPKPDGEPAHPAKRILSFDDIPDTIGAPPNDEEGRFAEMLAHIRSLLNERQWPLFYCTFVLEMRPREIAMSYPELGISARDVTIALYGIRKLLKADPGLGGLHLGISA
jgi:DNA-directed RNA polymerase specialized sigma24 family protein